ncbi:ABC transporter substrate-binding protein [Mobilicoccus pelagius]|uniref:Putative ABC transporter substrate-binding protein n=1 Tax=Mobilicoccus pelagius NBRC 104925 TaxID=1089455 RepID=H5UPT8_9MICO|nr:ABC transporter substrate-binding protein [Mobilicoccus pelagius]GAB47743.1 putative ABC transporter substrate-binding protein [Mobilicoccus pelagius NBRC 104925]
MRRLAALALAGSLVLTACSAGAGSSGTGGPSGAPSTDLAVGMIAEPANLDFTRTDGAAIPQALLDNVYEGLVAVDDDGRVVPRLAKSWDVSPDRRTYAFHLVEGATFSNGQPFTAADAVFSIDRVKKEWTTSLARAMDVVAKAEAKDEHTLVVTLTRPSNDWLYRMTTRIGAMFSRTGVDDLATTTVGTGPYTVDRWKRGDSLHLTRRDDYWGTTPFFTGVTLKYFKDPTALDNALLTNAIDVVSTVQAPESLGQFTNDPRFQVVEGTTNGEVVLSFNHARPPFDDPAVRRAARQAIDEKSLLQSCWAGRGTLIGSMVPPTDPWYEDLTGLRPHDPEAAKATLARSAHPDATVRLRLPTLPYATSCGQVVKSDLEKAGFRVTLDQLEFPAAWVTQVMKNGDYDASIVAHVEPRDLPTLYGNPDYYLHYDNPKVRAAIAAGDAGDEKTQVAKMKEAARLLAEDDASEWLFLLPNLVVAKKDVTGLPTNSVGESFDVTGLARG